jgi:hypothetical protein
MSGKKVAFRPAFTAYWSAHSEYVMRIHHLFPEKAAGKPSRENPSHKKQSPINIALKMG